MRTTLLLATTFVLAALARAADTPDAQTIAQKMKAALEPPASSTRRIVLNISAQDGERTGWTAAQARKPVGGQNRMLTVLLAPDDAQGIAMLSMDSSKTTGDVVALYIPAVRRVRQLAGFGRYEAFLHSDFTYADLGLLSMQPTYRLTGTEQRGGKTAYALEAIPKETWYYSRVVTWVDTATMFPIERNYYDPAGVLWKVEIFDNVTVIDGHPTALRITMSDKQAGSSTVLDVTAVKFGVELPDALFQPENLPTAGANPLIAALR